MISYLTKTYSDFVQRVRGWDYREPLRALEHSQWLEPEELEQARLVKLRALIKHCYHHVPFYRDEFDRIGIKPEDIAQISDLSKLPVIDKRTLREDYARFFASDRDRPVDKWSSSGSTGEPFEFRLDRNSTTKNTFANLARGRRWWGLDYGTREVMIWSNISDVSDTWHGRWLAARRRFSWRLKNIMVVDTYNLDSEAVRQQYQKLIRFRPRATRSISSGLFRFCQILDELGLDGRAIGIRYAIYTGEAFPPAQRKFVEEKLDCKTICEYGCSEVGIIAFECPQGGLHLSHESLISEFLKDGRPARPGEEAELVVTNLNDFATPMVRYAVGDMVVPTDDICACGRSLPMIESVGGRTHATIAKPDGGVIHGLFFTHLFDSQPVVSQFRVIQERIDLIRIELCSSETISDSVLSFIQTAVSKAMGGDATVEVSQLAELPLSRNGKFKWIVSHVND